MGVTCADMNAQRCSALLIAVTVLAATVPLSLQATAPANQRAEFEKAIAQSMTIDMQPLINAIYRTVKREMEASAGR